MPAEISFIDGTAEAAFALKPAWWDVANEYVLDHVPDSEEMIKAAHLDWNVDLQPIYYFCPLKYLEMVPLDRFGGNAEWRKLVQGITSGKEESDGIEEQAEFVARGTRPPPFRGGGHVKPLSGPVPYWASNTRTGNLRQAAVLGMAAPTADLFHRAFGQRARRGL